MGTFSIDWRTKTFTINCSYHSYHKINVSEHMKKSADEPLSPGFRLMLSI